MRRAEDGPSGRRRSPCLPRRPLRRCEEACHDGPCVPCMEISLEVPPPPRTVVDPDTHEPEDEWAMVRMGQSHSWIRVGGQGGRAGLSSPCSGRTTLRRHGIKIRGFLVNDVFFTKAFCETLPAHQSRANNLHPSHCPAAHIIVAAPPPLPARRPTGCPSPLGQEVRCRCGLTVIEPPILCGDSRVPKCTLPCSIPRECGRPGGGGPGFETGDSEERVGVSPPFVLALAYFLSPVFQQVVQ